MWPGGVPTLHKDLLGLRVLLLVSKHDGDYGNSLNRPGGALKNGKNALFRVKKVEKSIFYSRAHRPERIPPILYHVEPLTKPHYRPHIGAKGPIPAPNRVRKVIFRLFAKKRLSEETSFSMFTYMEAWWPKL